MAHADRFPEEVAKIIAQQVGQRLASVADPAKLAPGKPPELRETFSVWMLGLNAVTRSSMSLDKLVIKTRRWHHQIWYGGCAQAFARSVPTGPEPDDWVVTQLFESELAKRIDDAIEWVDQNDSGSPVVDDPLVRLLIMPAYFLHAFWLKKRIGDEHLLVIDRPNNFTHLKYETLYAPTQFLDTLAREQHVQGLPFPTRDCCC